MRWDEVTGTVGVFRGPSGIYTNGNTVDLQGRMVSCEHGRRQVTRIEHDGTTTVLADNFEGKRFNSPNDVVVKSDGSIWFTDPAYGIESDYEGFRSEPEIGGSHVYRIDPGNGNCTIVADDFKQPNGLAFSVDERCLYIVDSGYTHAPDGPRHIRQFEVGENGRLSGGDVFSECVDGIYDGLRLDEDGRIWVGAGDGVHCHLADGALAGKIKVPERVANLCFGGPRRNRLFLAATSSLYTVLLPVKGAKTF
jgi:gluconolactonase